MSIAPVMNRNVGISIVSHHQGDLVKKLLDDLEEYSASSIEVILTLNVPEELPFQIEEYAFPIRIIANQVPKGFGANHNYGFRYLSNNFFCVLNPDIRLQSDPFGPLSQCCNELASGLVAPLVVDASGHLEDSAREFPTPFSLLKKMFRSGVNVDYQINSQPFSPDWVAGMFMMFPGSVFEQIGGFDERFFLYYEDVDLCARLRLQGENIYLCPGVAVTHDARRESRRNLRYMRWHALGMLRFFLSPAYFKLKLASWAK